jgi:hypothetical protein
VRAVVSVISPCLCAFLAVGCQRPNDSTSSGSAPLAPDQEGHSLVEQKVAWPNAGTLDRQALASLTPDARVAVATSTVPVLVPADPKLLAAGVVVAEKVFFSFSADVDGLTVTVQGSRLAHQYDDIQPIEGTDSIRATKGLLTTNEGIEHASWSEFGVSYSLDLECADRRDARCAADHSYLRTVANGLRFVGPDADASGAAGGKQP